jgi:TolB-like protein/class 3 adenylate cyclase/Tfp pilus assembly protein PilF
LLTSDKGRRLAAILVADAVNYSLLMDADEEGTHRKLKVDLERVIEPLIGTHRGEVVKRTGDGMLAIFSSVVEAVDCAARIQGLVPRNGAEASPLLTYRIGINLGDIIVEEGDVFGNDVNIAARLEALSPPGGITLSGPAYWYVKSRTPLKFEELGFLRLKNIAEPIQVYRSVKDGAATADGGGLMRAGPPRTWSEGRTHHPEIVILPFGNLSSDPEQDYLCEGLTTDLTTDLARFSNLFVIAANTAFSYKGQHPSHERIRRELAAEYMVQGSVQRLGPQVRINAELIETRNGRTLWAERFNVPLQELFEVQDTVCRKIVVALHSKVSDAELLKVSRSAETENVNAYDALLKGLHKAGEFLGASETRQTLEEAKRWFRRAVEIDPSYGRPHGWLAYLQVLEWKHGWSPAASLPAAEELARKAVALDPGDHDTHWALASVYSNLGKFDQALAEYERALEINGNDANLNAEMADLLSYMGKHREAIGQIKFAMRINPRFPEWYRWTLGWCYYHIAEYGEAVAELGRLISLSDDALLILAASHARLAAAEGQGGAHAALARSFMNRFKERRPGWTLADQETVTYYLDPQDRAHWLEGLRLSGLE